MATEVKHAIRTTSGWSANQSAMEALYGVDGYYTLLSLWEDDIPADLVAADERWIAECYNDWPSGLDDILVVAARTTDETRNITIQVPASERHNGTPKTGFYIKPTGTYLRIIDFESNEVRHSTIIGVEVDAASQLNNYCFYFGQHSTIDSCLALNVLGSSRAGFIVSAYSQVKNSLALNCQIGFYTGYVINNTTKFYNCVATDSSSYGYDVPLYTNRVVILNNCIGYNNTTDFNFNATHINDIDYCASSDISAEGVNSITGITSVEFVGADSENFHLVETSQLRSAGLNLIDNPPNLTSPQYDIDGDQWPDTGAWDIGFDYFVGGAPPAAGTIYLGGTEITTMKLGDVDITKAYLGDTQVFGN